MFYSGVVMLDFNNMRSAFFTALKLSRMNCLELFPGSMIPVESREG